MSNKIDIFRKKTLFSDMIFIGMAMFFFMACEEKKKVTNPMKYNGPIMTTENMTVMVSDSGRTKVKVTTAKQLKYQSEDEFYPKAVYVTFFDKNSVEYSSLRGDSGRFHKTDGVYEIMGNVFFFNRLQQQSLNTDLLFWSPVKKKVYTDKKVKIKTLTDEILGIGMEADQDFSKYRIKKVTGKFAVDSLTTESDSEIATDTTSN